MAITLTGRPRVLIADLSPEGTFYSNWNATGKYDRINYTFNIQQADLQSRLRIDIKEFGSNLLLASNSYRPFKTGAMTIDISTFVKSYIYSTFNPDFDVVNSIDVGCSLRFYIEYTQIDEVGATTFATDVLNPIYAVHAAMPIGHTNGSNMFEYVPVQADITDKALFLTAFDVPVKFEGYPMAFSFLFDGSLGGKEVFLKQAELDVNQSSIDDANYELDLSKINRVNHITIQPILNANVGYLEISLQTGNDAPQYYVDAGYVDEGYTQIINN